MTLHHPVADDRALMRAVDEHLLATTGVVLDDVVLRAWGNGRPELTHRMLEAAIGPAGSPEADADRWAVATAIAAGTAIESPPRDASA